MADEKISAMPAAGTLDGSELLPVVQAGGNFSLAVNTLFSTIGNILSIVIGASKAIFFGPGAGYFGTDGNGNFLFQSANGDGVFRFDAGGNPQLVGQTVVVLEVDPTSGTLVLPTLPTTDPAIPNGIWNNSGILQVSAS